VYGDTHVDPTPLFNPGAGQSPPPDAIDVYFHAPLTLSLLGDAFAANTMTDDLDRLLAVYAGLAARTITDLQRQGGYVTGGHRGHAIPARLELTAVADNEVPEQPAMRLHTHIYIGRTAVALETGERHPVALDRLERAADHAWTGYKARLVDETSRAFGLVWGAQPGQHSGRQEIVDPPLVEHITGQQLGVCPGGYGPREQLLADARWRADIEEMERFMAADEQRRTG